tara:strand:+ start:928 stop:1485 length:558 start_codon:yes stop_codon:yes gene_type:complete
MKINKNVTIDEVTNILLEDKIVGFFQGASEAGHRALGNRSLLMSPLKVENKDTMNLLKGRELFRPLAASVMQDKAKEWFDLLGLEESPYMTFSFNVKKDKKQFIPSVVHVDDTCRIQTVKAEQNKLYYDLLSNFYNKTQVPMLLNTSFNNYDEPIVETIDDAVNTFQRISLSFLYFPQANILLTK